MIKTISIQNWKSLTRIQSPIEAGTTFVIARNGVGKSSLLQAIHFGLFGGANLAGSGSDLSASIGPHASSAEVTVSVEVSGDTWNISRSISLDARKHPKVASSFLLNEERACTEGEWQAAYAAATQTDFNTLKRLVYVSEGEAYQRVKDAGQYDLLEHVSQILGLTDLSATARVAKKMAGLVSRDADRKRLTIREHPKQVSNFELRSLEEGRTQLEIALTELTVRHQELEEVYSILQAWRSYDNAMNAWKDVYLRVYGVLADALETFGDVDIPVLFSEVHAALPGGAELAALGGRILSMVEAVHGLEQRVDAENRLIDSERFQLAASMVSIEEALALTTHSNTCSLCEQVLDEQTSNHLEAKLRTMNEQALGRLRDLESRRARNDEALTKLSLAQREASTLGNLPEEPNRERDHRTLEQIDAERTHAEHAALDIRERLDGTLRQLGAANQRAQDENDLKELEADLFQSYKLSDCYQLLAGVAGGLASRIFEEQVEPVVQILQKRWVELWPGRPALKFNPSDGALHGVIDDRVISFSDMSAGERVVAMILLRVLALQAASSCDVLMLDEPIEHLDPRNRRMLVGLLTAVGRAADGVPRQLLVTSYEESLTRRIGHESPHDAHVWYI